MPGVIQRYNIEGIYDRYIEHVSETVKPKAKILNDAQIVHDTLNNPRKADIYFSFTNRWVKERVEEMGVTPMRALASIVGGHVGGVTKLSKVFEVTSGELPFLKTAKSLKNLPFHDVSAGLHHGEYEHGMQLHFISDMYKYPNLYGTTGLRTSYQNLLTAMLDPQYVINTPEGDQLSLWSLVMDIQGGFIKGKKNKGKEGVRFLFQEHEADPYEGTFGTSATLMHYGFGYGSKIPSYKSMEHGELAHRYPYIAEAVLNRGLKRQEEAFGEGPFKSYKGTAFGRRAKKERRVKAQEWVKTFKPINYEPVKWNVPPQGIVAIDQVRTNVIR